jgi:copper chaperone CopZ
LLLAAVSLPAVTPAADPLAAAPKPAARARESGPPRLYVATGPTSEADLARLRAAIGKLAGVTKVETRPEFGAVTVTIDGDASSTESLRGAAARSAGFVMRAVLPRYYAAAGSNAEADLRELRAGLEKVAGVEQVELSGQAAGAAVRVLGVMEHAALAAAAKSAGYTLRPRAAYVASGPSAAKELTGLRAAMEQVAGVEQVEIHGMTGGATLLIHGDAREPLLVAAAHAAGFALWPLTNAPGPRIFRIDSSSSPADPRRLREALQGLAGIGAIEIRAGLDGGRLVVTGGRVRPDAIIAAAAGLGCSLTPVAAPVTLPTLLPEAGRSTPPDYDARVLEERAHLGEPAPAFKVLDGDGSRHRTLADYLAAGKPVVLVFGSCSCPRFLAACGPLEQLYQAYKERVTFLLVYIAEAHPGQILAFPAENGGEELRIVPLVATESQTLDNLRRLVRLANLTIPAAIESPANSVNRDYAAYPNRLYAIGVDGKVAFKGAPGPTGLKVPDLADWLRENVK